MNDDESLESTTPAERIQWHRLFGIALGDLLAGSPWEVELEKELSMRRQLLDVVILRRVPGKFEGRLPDGLEPLTDYNLLTFKSFHESLDDWTLKELTGHFVNYRKQLAAPNEPLVPEDRFRLLAVCARFPRKLNRELELQRLSNGVHEVVRGTDKIRVIVLNEIPLEEHNSLWHLFSAVPEKVQFGAEYYRPKTRDTSGILNRLFESYNLEGLSMPYTIVDFRRDFARDHLSLLTPAERVEGLLPEERVKGLLPEERVKGLPPEERLKGLLPEERLKGLPPEERLKGLPPEERLKGLQPEERLKGLQPEERVKGLLPEERVKGLPTEDRLKGLPADERLEGLAPDELRKLIESARWKLERGDDVRTD